MADTRWTIADARKYLADSGRQLAPGSMALEEEPTLSATSRAVTETAAPICQQEPIYLTLPFPPTLNNLRAWVNGRLITSKAGRDYCALVGTAIYQQYGYDMATLTGSLSVTILAYPPDKRRRDLDNLGKCLLDALKNAGVYEDDSQIDDLRYIRGEQKQPGSITVTIQERTPHDHRHRPAHLDLG